MQIDRSLLAMAVAILISALPQHLGFAAEDTPAEKTEAPAPGEPTEDEDAPPPVETVGGQMGEVSLEKFIPSEEITADGAVSFPVDI